MPTKLELQSICDRNPFKETVRIFPRRTAGSAGTGLYDTTDPVIVSDAEADRPIDEQTKEFFASTEFEGEKGVIPVWPHKFSRVYEICYGDQGDIVEKADGSCWIVRGIRKDLGGVRWTLMVTLAAAAGITLPPR